MLVTDQTDDAAARAPRGPISKGTKVGLVAAVLLVVGLRHDYWNWLAIEPLLVGVVPVGLWWQAMVSVLTSLVLLWLVRVAWPQDLEKAAEPRVGKGGRDSVREGAGR